MKAHRHTCLHLFMLLILLVACTAAPQAPLEVVTVQFNDIHSYDFAGFYTALKKGFYNEAGISVEFVPMPAAIADSVGIVAHGNAEFGVSSAEEVIRGYAAGWDVKAVAAIYRETPLATMSLTSENILRPQDLVGKTVSVFSYGSRGAPSRDVLFLALLKGQGIPSSEMSFTTAQDPYGANSLINGQADARSAVSLTQEAVEAAQTAANDSTKECRYIYFGEYGVRTYVNVIITAATLINERPDLVRRFVQATMKGYQYSIEHPDEAAQFTYQVDPTLDPQMGVTAIEASIPLIDIGKDVLGWMEEPVWETSQSILLGAVMLSAPVPLNQVYTNDFLLSAAP